MREIVSKPLDRESFRPYGDFVDLLHIKQMDAMAGADNIFMPDLTTLRLDERMQASVCVARVSQCERIITAVDTMDLPAREFFLWTVTLIYLWDLPVFR